jgi:hypothetical protein
MPANIHVAHPMPPSVPSQACECLIDMAGDVAGDYVLVIGNDMPGLFDVLAHRGAAEIVRLSPSSRPDAGTMDIALVTGIASVDHADRAVAMSRHAVSGTGRIAVRALCEPAGGLVDGVARVLRNHGFGVIRSRDTSDSVIIHAVLPLFGTSARR